MGSVRNSIRNGPLIEADFEITLSLMCVSDGVSAATDCIMTECLSRVIVLRN
jgi:hypothetical protein